MQPLLEIPSLRPEADRPDAIRLAASMAAFRPSVLREILGRAQREDLVSFAVGTPATDLLPVAELAEAAGRVLAETGRRALQYGLPSPALKAHVVELMAARGVECREEQVFLTAGAQQGMDLLARLLLEPGGTVLLEEAAYEGIRLAIRGFAPRVLTVPTGLRDGLDPDALEDRLARGPRPAFLYLMAEGHNPVGSTLPAAARERVVELADRFGVPVLEDDVYGLLRLDGGDGLAPAAAPPLRALDGRWVFYLGSFSKIVAPSLRVGWIVAPAELVGRLSVLKHAADVDSTTLGQHIVARYLDTGALPAHLDRLRAEYRRRRDAMLAALERRLPPGCRWSRPRAGIFVWVELPEGADSSRLLEPALAAGVAFCPGEAFAAGGPERLRRCLRLSYADNPPERIDEGVARLARVLAEAL
ncbi:MAG TPA: PLP-dependent aminotransferase family protein [Thermoanaerobaculia bacterium]|nr:PLP-dependent aminotransferase family protein [Thermoanaerobaculia bacterium]